MKRWSFFLAGLAACVAVTLNAWSQSDVSPFDVAPTSSPFAEGSWTLDAFALAVTDIASGPTDHVAGGGIGVNYYFADALAFRTELIGLGVDQAGEDATATGVSFLGRWHFLERDRFSLFVEGGVGMLLSDASIPDDSPTNVKDGTHFNFTPQASLGATFRITDRTHLVGAARYLHISNADMSGDDENPGTDFVGGYLGLMWEF